MQDDTQRRQERHRFVREHSATDPDGLSPAGADAGARAYWRLPDGTVLMDAPPADNDVATWLHVQTLLADGGVCVPRILASDLSHGFVLMQDLGRRTMLDCIDEDNADRYMDAAFTQLLRLQAITPPTSLPRYDATLLGRELDLFPDWFLGRELRLGLTPDERQTWQSARQFLIDEALAQPTALVHRDFMPRNLMPTDAMLAVIDFQDAVRGPIAYDPLCLVKDAFISWPAGRVEGWLRRYHDRACEMGLPVPPWPRFRRDVDLIGVQRHLKVVGIFARLKHRDHKPHYLDDAARFQRYLDEVMPHHAPLAALHAWLEERVWPAWHAAVNP